MRNRLVLLGLAMGLMAAHPVAAADMGRAQSVARYRARIAALDKAGPRVNAIIALNPSAEAQQAAASRMPGPLAGKVVLVKDNIETADPMPTTAGSLALADNRTGRDAPIIAGLRRAGVVILGKTNLSDWANFRSSRSVSGWSGVGGLTRNPYALDRSPCGSSAGSGAAVAAGFAWAAIGTETDGSITCPASVAGLVGFKPTVGLLSRTYIVPITHQQDTPGPMTKTVRDAALLLTAMAGSDPADPDTREADAHRTDFAAGLDTATLKGKRIGVLRKFAGDNAAVTALFDRALADMKRAGAEIVELDFKADDSIGRDEFATMLYDMRVDLDAYLAGLPGQPAVRSLADVIAFNRAHAATELRWFDQDLLEQAAKATDKAAYDKARADALRRAGPEGIDRLLADKHLDLLVAPTDTPAWPIDFVTEASGLSNVGASMLPAVAGYPHLTVPMGAIEHLPVGLSFIAGKWDDKRVLEAGAAYERARTAPLAAPQFKRWDEIAWP